MKPEIAKFIARYHRPQHEVIAQEVAPYLNKTPIESLHDLEALCRGVAELLAEHPEREAILAEQEPPHPSYHKIMARLRAQFRASRHE